MNAWEDCPDDLPAIVGYPGTQRWLALYQAGDLTLLDDGQIRCPVPAPAAEQLQISADGCLLADLAELQLLRVSRQRARQVLASQAPRGPVSLDDLHQLERQLTQTGA